MTAREWKPGDVAMRTAADGRESLAVCVVGSCHANGSAHWHTIYPDSRTDWDSIAYEGVAYLPLVVIDPEDREAVERLAETFWANWSGCDGSRSVALQAALREFAIPKPSKPDEPQGLGAVVEDEDGVLWVRAGKQLQTPDHWRATSGENLVGWWATWERIAAVRVLSPGVEVDQ